MITLVKSHINLFGLVYLELIASRCLIVSAQAWEINWIIKNNINAWVQMYENV